MNEENFTIDDVLKMYEQIADNYREGWISKEQAEEDIKELNKTCKENNITFEADIKSLELHTSSEEESSEDFDDSSYY